MNGTSAPGRNQLTDIAHEAMLQRGLLPDFSPAVVAETDAITRAAVGARTPRSATCAACSGRRSTTTTRATSTSSRWPSRWRAARSKILVAIADVDALVNAGSRDRRPCAGQHDLRLHGGRDLSRCCRRSCRPTSRRSARARSGWRSSIEMVVAADGTVTASDIYRALVLNRAKLAYNSVAAWLDGTAPAPAALAGGAGARRSSCASRTGSAQALKGLRHAHGALRLETLEARAVFDGDALADLLPDEKNRAKELIEDFMIAANGVTATIPRAEGLPVAAPGAALAEALGPHRRAGRRSWASDLPLSARTPRRSTRSSRQRRQADPARFPDLSLSVVKLLGSGEYALEAAGRPVGGALRAGGEGLHPLHGAEPPLSGPHHAAPAEGGAGRAAGAVQQRRARDAGAPLHRAGGQRRQGRAAGAQVRRGAAARPADRRRGSTPS